MSDDQVGCEWVSVSSGTGQRAEMRMVRWMCGIKLKDRLPSKELRERLGIDDIALVLQQNGQKPLNVCVCVCVRACVHACVCARAPLMATSPSFLYLL